MVIDKLEINLVSAGVAGISKNGLTQNYLGICLCKDTTLGVG